MVFLSANAGGTAKHALRPVWAEGFFISPEKELDKLTECIQNIGKKETQWKKMISRLREQLQADLAGADTARKTGRAQGCVSGQERRCDRTHAGIGRDEARGSARFTAKPPIPLKPKSKLQSRMGKPLFSLQHRTKPLPVEKIDVTLPGRVTPVGALHPMTQLYHEVRDIFASMGFSVVDGPEVEFDKYNFEMLNIPKDHPAREHTGHFLCFGRYCAAHAYVTYAGSDNA